MKEGDKKIFRIDYYYYITTTDRPQGWGEGGVGKKSVLPGLGRA